MGLFIWLNARVLAAIDKRSGTAAVRRVRLSGGRIEVDLSDGSRQAWRLADLARVVAIRRDLYAGDEVSLLLDLLGPSVVEVPASSDGWFDLCTQLEQFDGAVPFVQWHAKALLAALGEPMTVWARAEI